jgi:hypothetical protein
VIPLVAFILELFEVAVFPGSVNLISESIELGLEWLIVLLVCTIFVSFDSRTVALAGIFSVDKKTGTM